MTIRGPFVNGIACTDDARPVLVFRNAVGVTGAVKAPTDETARHNRTATEKDFMVCLVLVELLLLSCC